MSAHSITALVQRLRAAGLDVPVEVHRVLTTYMSSLFDGAYAAGVEWARAQRVERRPETFPLPALPEGQHWRAATCTDVRSATTYFTTEYRRPEGREIHYYIAAKDRT